MQDGLYWMSQTKKNSISQDTCSCLCGRETRENKGTRRSEGARMTDCSKWMNVGLFTLGYILKDNTLLSDWLPRPVPGQITQPHLFLTKSSPCGIAAQIVALRLWSKACFTLSFLRLEFRFRRAHPVIDLHLKFVCVFPPLSLSQPELRGFLRCQRGQRCLCISGSDRSPGLKSKFMNADTHTVISFLFFDPHSYSLAILPVTPGLRA